MTPGKRAEGSAMERDDTPPPPRIVAANDSPLASIDRARTDAAVISIARLIGRQIARETFAKRHVANDNASSGEGDDEG